MLLVDLHQIDIKEFTPVGFSIKFTPSCEIFHYVQNDENVKLRILWLRVALGALTRAPLNLLLAEKKENRRILFRSLALASCITQLSVVFVCYATFVSCRALRA